MLAQSAAPDDTDDSVASDSSSDAAAAQAPQQRNLLLIVAASGGDLATLNRLLDEGANPNYVNDRGFNGLFMAVTQNHTDCVARLLEVGANPNHYANAISRLPLTEAASDGNADVIRLLLAGGAQVDFDPPDMHGHKASPLHHAIDSGDLESISLLLAAGADPNKKKELNYGFAILNSTTSPLANVVEKIKYWDAGANVLLHYQEEHALRDAARRCKVLPMLLRAGASINEPAITAKFQEFQNLYKNDPNKPHYRKAIEYLRAVRAAGGFPAYARAHRSMFAAIFSRGTRLPADVIPKIVDFWAHLGWYEYSVPGTGSRVVATGREESSSS